LLSFDSLEDRLFLILLYFAHSFFTFSLPMIFSYTSLLPFIVTYFIFTYPLSSSNNGSLFPLFKSCIYFRLMIFEIELYFHFFLFTAFISHEAIIMKFKIS